MSAFNAMGLKQLEETRNEISVEMHGILDTVKTQENELWTDEQRTRYDELENRIIECDDRLVKVRSDAEKMKQRAKLKLDPKNDELDRPDENGFTREERIAAFRGWLRQPSGTHGPTEEMRAAAEKLGVNLLAKNLPVGFRRGAAPRTAEEVRRNYAIDGTEAQKRAQAVGTGAAGGHLVNPELIAAYEEALLYYARLRTKATVFRTATGATLPIPSDNDTVNEGELVSENNTATEQDVTLGSNYPWRLYV